MIKQKEAIWLTTVFLIHFLHVPTMLAPVPSSLCDKTVHHYTVLKLPALLFQFLSAEQWVLVCLLQLYNIKGCLQNATIALNPVWMPSSLARVQIFALFSVRVFISGVIFFLLLFSAAVSDYQERHIQTQTFMFFSCLLLYDCSSCLPCCCIWGSVGTAARHWQSCTKLSLLWTYIHNLTWYWTPPVKGYQDPTVVWLALFK